MKDRNFKSIRINEWFVPTFGPLKFRAFIGMLFLPYTGMCISFTIIGSMLSESIMWDRVLSIFVIYFLALGVSAHAADNLGSKKIKPWGNFFTTFELKLMVIGGLSVSYALGIYYIITFAPLLLIIAIIEGFFLFAYNFELFNGFFHNNFWFAVSWGSLPLLAGFVIQTNSISLLSLFSSIIAFLVAYSEIRISRIYKELKRRPHHIVGYNIKKLELYLKILSLTTIVFAIILTIYKYFIQ
ncbi:MAG: hypothetical protein K0S93_314 [Nitrososphaeraceae archaeon]|jgi:hypothetical protein|nr:hypothetical protein [Nitrososphaeraceae archaeon]